MVIAIILELSKLKIAESIPGTSYATSIVLTSVNMTLVGQRILDDCIGCLLMLLDFV